MTRRVALIGNPLRRRHSEVMHNAAFAASGIDARFELRELPPEDIAGFVASARSDQWLGFGVTAPYKRSVMAHLDEVEADATAIGAVNNTVRQGDGSMVGFNTDAVGFAVAVRDELEIDLRGARIVLAGAGGAAHAVAHACVERGASELTIVNRSVAPGEELVHRFGGTPTNLAVCQPTDPVAERALASADLLVNATTVGMLDSGMAVRPELLPARAAVFDLVYTPVETELLARARERDLRVCNGVAMLVAQGVAAFERWTGIDGSSEVMRRALEPLLREDPAA